MCHVVKPGLQDSFGVSRSLEALQVILRMLQSLWRESEGTALVEGAVLVPMMMVFLGGVF
jgi:hypothetical protein